MTQSTPVRQYPVCKKVPLARTVRDGEARRKYPLTTMAVGDMFFVPNLTKNTLVSHVSTVAKVLGRRFATRLTYMRVEAQQWVVVDSKEVGAIQGVGVWRTA